MRPERGLKMSEWWKFDGGFDDRSVSVAVLVEAILNGGAYKATKYFNDNDKLTVKATRKLFNYNGRKVDKRLRSTEIMVTIGRPNYEEREFIKKAKKAGQSFPAKAVLVKYPKGKG